MTGPDGPKPEGDGSKPESLAKPPEPSGAPSPPGDSAAGRADADDLTGSQATNGPRGDDGDGTPLDARGDSDAEDADLHAEAWSAHQRLWGFASANVRNLVSDCHITGNVVFGAVADGVVAPDVTLYAREMSEALIAPDGFDCLIDRLRDRRLLLLIGASGAGRFATAVAVLWRQGATSVVQVPAGISADAFVAFITSWAQRHQGTGFVVKDLPDSFHAALTAPECSRLRGVLADERCWVVCTVDVQVQGRRADAEIDVAQVEPPPLSRLLDGLAPSQGTAFLDRARRLADGLDTCTYSTVRRLIDVLADAPDADDETLLNELRLGHTRAVVRHWLTVGRLGDGTRESPGRGSAELALTVAGLVASGAPTLDVYRWADDLARALDGSSIPLAQERRHTTEPLVPAPDLVERRCGAVAGAHGLREEETFALAPQIEGHEALLEMWESLGGPFRRPYLQWLKGMPESGRQAVFSAGIAAGSLFAAEPSVAERELLTPWARSRCTFDNEAAALAVAVPALVGRPTETARNLVTWWSALSGAPARTAAKAYAGPLGVWDGDCPAATRLWAIGREHEGANRPAADQGLIFLAIGSSEPEAARARTSVFGLLASKMQSTSRSDRDRAQTIFTRMMRQLLVFSVYDDIRRALVTGGNLDGAGHAELVDCLLVS